jgi:hypothetical protein
MEPGKKIPLTFITGNKKKLEEFLTIMSEDLAAHYSVTNKEIDRKLTTLPPFKNVILLNVFANYYAYS